MIHRTVETRTLYCLALLALATHGAFQMILNHTGRTTDGADFVLGSLMGVVIGLLGVIAWRNGRHRTAK